MKHVKDLFNWGPFSTQARCCDPGDYLGYCQCPSGCGCLDRGCPGCTNAGCSKK